MSSSRIQLLLERLEDRCTPAMWQNPWPDASHLTLSFAPDGTRLGDHASTLFQTLNALAPTETWQREILRAIQAWTMYANINFALAADSGAPFGATGALQSDARFGDIRIGAFPMTGVLAEAAPFDVEAGTWSGDVPLNSLESFRVDGGGPSDLFSILLHEAGHVLGLDHNSDPGSVMYPDYLGVRSGPSLDDIAALRRLYGMRLPDRFDSGAGNESRSTATRLNLLANADGSLAMTVAADVTALGDRDTFAFTPLLTTGRAVLTIRTAGLSILTPRVSVYDGAGKQIVSAVSTDPWDGGLVIRLDRVKPLSTYYVQIESGQQNPFGVGAYEFTVSCLPALNSLIGSLTATVSYGVDAVTNSLTSNDLHTNDSFATALLLPSVISSADARFDYGYRASLSDSWDVDFYSVQAPASVGGGDVVLTAMAWGLVNDLAPRVRVFDAQRQPVAAEVIVSEGGSYVVQVTHARAGANYYVQVVAGPGINVGNYFLGVDFGNRSVQMETYASGELTTEPATQTLTVTESLLFHFVLSANAPVTMTITDSTGRVIFTLRSGGEAVSGKAILGAGTFTVRFSSETTGAPATFQLKGNVLTSPIGPEPTDSTMSPSGSTTPGASGQDTSTIASSDSSSGGGVPPKPPASDPQTTDSTSGGTASTTTADSGSSTTTTSSTSTSSSGEELTPKASTQSSGDTTSAGSSPPPPDDQL